MAKYSVTITRLQSQSATIEVEAESAEVAMRIGYEQREQANFENSGDPMDYEVEDAEALEPVDEENREDDSWHDQWESHEFGDK